MAPKTFSGGGKNNIKINFSLRGKKESWGVRLLAVWGLKRTGI